MSRRIIFIVFLLGLFCNVLSANETWIRNLAFEREFIETLEDYIESQESVLQLLRKQLLSFKVEHQDASGNPEKYFVNALNQFLMLKRLAVDTSQLSDKTFYVAKNFKVKVDSMKSENSFPSQNDLVASAKSLAVLQKSQKLSTDKLAKGIFGDIKIRNSLSTMDCYLLGKQLNSPQAQEYSLAVEWQTEALKRFDDYYDQYQVKAVDILEELALSFMRNNQNQEAEKVVEKLSRMNAKSLAVKAFKSPVQPSKAERPQLCIPEQFLSLNSFTCPK